MIAIVDYGMGNLMSVQKALEKLGAKTILTNNPETISKSKKLILPGVGAFGDAVKGLKAHNLENSIRDFIKSNKPFLGICLGLHILFEESEESTDVKGLGILKGKVAKFKTNLKVPHMGWNSIKIMKKSPILKNIDSGSYVYFVHSYYVEPRDKKTILTLTNYDTDFASMIWKDNIFACQFHPEKSQNIGLKILENFIKIS